MLKIIETYQILEVFLIFFKNYIKKLHEVWDGAATRGVPSRNIQLIQHRVGYRVILPKKQHHVSKLQNLRPLFSTLFSKMKIFRLIAEMKFLFENLQ